MSIMQPSNHPILYSYRRCPYAMRARFALAQCGRTVILREISLREKPAELLDASPKGTVPVLILPDGKVIDESLDIMRWAFDIEQVTPPDAHDLIQANDQQFKPLLDRYKYADRYPEHPPAYYRAQGLVFLAELEQRLAKHPFLLGQQASLADIAIFPFVRQFSLVDATWFDQENSLLHLKQWLAHYLSSQTFSLVMHRYQTWQPTDTPALFPSSHEET